MSDATRVKIAFGQKLAQLRTDRELSQGELADRDAVHRTSIAKPEKDQHLPQLDTILKLAASLEVEPSQMVSGLPAWDCLRPLPDSFG